MLLFIGSLRHLFFALLLLAWAPLTLAQQQAPESELKAAILFNMLSFVDWPTQSGKATDRLTVCYLTTGPVPSALVQIGGKLPRAKLLQVVPADAENLSSCHALYVSPLDAASLPHIVPRAQRDAVLLVGDNPGYLQQGVMLNLEVNNGRIVFDVDLRAVRQARLLISSKVLRLARQVLE